MNKNKYKVVEDFFMEPLTFRQKIKLKKLQFIHEVLTIWEFWKSKLIFILIGMMFGWIIGLPMGALIEHKNEKFWQSVILEPNRIEQFEEITELAIELEKRLDALKLELDAYWMPESSPDIERLSRER